MKCVSWFVGIGNHISVFCFVWKRGWAGHSTSVLGVRSFVLFSFLRLLVVWAANQSLGVCLMGVMQRNH